MPYAQFETELIVRPDDIDMNNHVHNSRYFDYVLAARYDQMKRCYGMSMDEFIARGYSWVVKTCHVEYKRPLVLGDTIIVRTGILEVARSGVRVRFEIVIRGSGKLSAEGYFDYTMISARTGKPEAIPPDIVQKYSI
jgi:acyl-CoA thioester hydrolase/thioesterase-3